jgi:hypothetical protein
VLLKTIGTVVIPAVGLFIVRSHFKISSKGPVKICYLGLTGGEKNWIDKSEEPIRETTLCYAELTEDAMDGAILFEIGYERIETTFGQIFALLRRQPNGGRGVLRAKKDKGGTNIFYVHNSRGDLLVLSVHWFNDHRGNGWRVVSGFWGGPIIPNKWYAGSRVFFHLSDNP